jgi:hypothetical protein
VATLTGLSGIGVSALGVVTGHFDIGFGTTKQTFWTLPVANFRFEAQELILAKLTVLWPPEKSESRDPDNG